MDDATRNEIMEILAQGRHMTLATVRPDGWPQANTLSYAHDGLTLYVATETDSSKADNIRQSDTVSCTIDLPSETWDTVKGVSMAATASFVTHPEELADCTALLDKKFPAFGDTAEGGQGTYEVIRLEPVVISIIDYSQGFGHRKLVTI